MKFSETIIIPSKSHTVTTLVSSGLITSLDPPATKSDLLQENIFFSPESGFSLEERTTCFEMKQAAKLNRLSFALVAILLIYCFSLMVSWRVRGQQTLKNVQMQQKVHEPSSHEAARNGTDPLFELSPHGGKQMRWK